RRTRSSFRPGRRRSGFPLTAETACWPEGPTTDSTAAQTVGQRPAAASWPHRRRSPAGWRPRSELRTTLASVAADAQTLKATMDGTAGRDRTAHLRCRGVVVSHPYRDSVGRADTNRLAHCSR